MVWDGKGERRATPMGLGAECRGALWSLPDGQRLPSFLDAPLALGDPDHPARLRATDLEDPSDFHQRLATWLLKQGQGRE